tara:strand:- start:44 stop:160 length:117 start_codon:yes stop_codon:yes gene_type:complete
MSKNKRKKRMLRAAIVIVALTAMKIVKKLKIHNTDSKL